MHQSCESDRECEVEHSFKVGRVAKSDAGRLDLF